MCISFSELTKIPHINNLRAEGYILFVVLESSVNDCWLPCLGRASWWLEYVVESFLCHNGWEVENEDESRDQIQPLKINTAGTHLSHLGPASQSCSQCSTRKLLETFRAKLKQLVKINGMQICLCGVSILLCVCDFKLTFAIIAFYVQHRT